MKIIGSVQIPLKFIPKGPIIIIITVLLLLSVLLHFL